MFFERRMTKTNHAKEKSEGFRFSQSQPPNPAAADNKIVAKNQSRAFRFIVLFEQQNVHCKT